MYKYSDKEAMEIALELVKLNFDRIEQTGEDVTKFIKTVYDFLTSGDSKQ